MGSFSPVFGGGGAIYPAQQTYVAVALTANTTLQWPLEQQVGGSNIAAAIVGVIANAGFAITLSSAELVSNGYAILFDNLGANSFNVKDNSGNVLLTVASGQAWVLYLSDNSTVAGTWRSFQQGAGASSANAATLAGAGLKAITTTLNQRWQVNSQGVNYALLDADRAKLVVWTGGTGTFTLPNPATVGSDWFAPIKNAGSGSLTLSPAAGTIDGSASIILATEESAFVATDGANWFTIGFGQAVNSVFDFVSIDASGTGDLTLTGAQLNRVSYQFTGILTGNRNIIVPAAVQQYWVDNETTGAFTLTVKTAAVAGVAVPQGSRVILYCDGTTVVNAETLATNVPSVVQGDLLAGSAPGTLVAIPKSAAAHAFLSNTGAANQPAWSPVYLSGSVTIDFPNIPAGTLTVTTFAVAGAAVGDPVAVGCSLSVSGLVPYAQVTAPNTVSAGFQNASAGGIDPASATFKVAVFH
jgi:hypothetical protein